ncbi:MAG: alpha/beta hydrolase [Jatrophihabitantaceae bacterium]
MAIPLQTAVFWKLLSTLTGKSMFQLPNDKVRAASDRQRRATRLPGASLITGRANRDVLIIEQTATVPDGTDLGVVIYRPRGTAGQILPVIVNFHGGGFIAGDPYQSQWWCSSVAGGVGAVVVSVDYRLAPEHPFPAAPEDCYAATVWTIEHAEELGIDPARLAVMGDSAGGNLAAVVALMARDRGGPSIAFQLLLYPSVEFVDSFPSEDENAHAPILGKADLGAASGRYCTAEQAITPYASPLRAPSHAGLPPALIQTAQHDPLRDQGSAYAQALQAAGVPARLTNYVDAVHGYISIPGVVPAARQALGEAVAVLRDALAAV